MDETNPGDADERSCSNCLARQRHQRHRHTQKFLFCQRYAQLDQQCSLDERDGAGGLDQPDVSMVNGKLGVSQWDIVLVLLSLVGYVLDLVTDWLVAYYHFIHGRHVSALLIAVFAVVPTLVLNAVSFGWYLESPYPNISKRAPVVDIEVEENPTTTDNNHVVTCSNGAADVSCVRREERRRESNSSSSSHRIGAALYWRFFACLLQLGPVLYHIDWLRYAWRLRVVQQKHKTSRHSTMKWSSEVEQRRACELLAASLLQADRDATLLRLFEAFLEAAPQLLIQLHLILDVYFVRQNAQHWNETIHGHPPNYALMLISIGFSLFSLALALVSQHRSLRLSRFDKRRMTSTGCALQLIWRLLTLSARLFCLCLFTIVFRWWLAAVLAVHFVLVVLHITVCQAIDFGSHWILEKVVILMGAFVNLFAPFNMAEGRTRWRYVYLYVLEAVENTALMLAVIVALPDDRRQLLGATALLVAFGWLSGVLVMLLYYVHLHPNVLDLQLAVANAGNANGTVPTAAEEQLPLRQSNQCDVEIRVENVDGEQEEEAVQ